MKGGVHTGAGWVAEGEFFQDPRLRDAGILHGVTTRSSGNMRDKAVRQAALGRAGAGSPEGQVLKQVHGDRILQWEPSSPVEAQEADGWITREKGRPLCVFIADCVPLFLWTSDANAAGIFHSGWRGTALEFGRKAALAFGRAWGIKPESLNASIGPHIGACCFKVGPEVAERFPQPSVQERDGGLYIDLGAEIARQLEEEGLDPARVETRAPCTSCNPELFFSYRRDKSGQSLMGFLSL